MESEEVLEDLVNDPKAMIMRLVALYEAQAQHEARAEQCEEDRSRVWRSFYGDIHLESVYVVRSPASGGVFLVEFDLETREDPLITEIEGAVLL